MHKRVIIPKNRVEREEVAKLIQRKLNSAKKEKKLVVRLGRAT